MEHCPPRAGIRRRYAGNHVHTTGTCPNYNDHVADNNDTMIPMTQHIQDKVDGTMKHAVQALRKAKNDEHIRRGVSRPNYS
jgi:hypothetical protein